MVTVMGPDTTNGHTNGLYNYRLHRSNDLRRSNRRIGLIALFAVILLVIFTVVYVVFFGGANMGPMPPLHSSVVAAGAWGTA